MTIQEIEKALIKRYRNKIYNQFIKAINEYDLLKDGDTIAVCISGGKDSFVLAKLFQEYCRYGKYKINAKYIVMDPGFNKQNLDNLITNSEKLGIPIKIKKSNIFKVASNHGGENPCYLCARMRRGFLYQFAKEEGCNKIALGHHFNDVIETTLLNVFYGGTFKTMLPKLKAENFSDMELIRPLYFVEEKNIINYMNYCEVVAMNCGCEVASGALSSKRREIKQLIAKMKENYKDVEKSIFQSANNINLDCVLGWVKNNKKTNFNDIYKE